jgi:hypothetical protein
MKKFGYILATCLLSLIAFCVWCLQMHNRAEVHNSSGRTVEHIQLDLHGHDGDWTFTKRVETLKPGHSVRVRHHQTDLTAELRFEIDGKKVDYKEGYIDLWSGEGWRFDIQADGSVKAGYDSQN